MIGICLSSYAQPEWVAETGMQYSMTVFAKVKINGTLLTSPSSRIGAFKDDKCWGFSDIFEGPWGWEFQLLIEYESSTGNIGLKVWDSSTGIIHDIQEEIGFVNDTKLGEINEPLEFTVTTEQTNQAPELTTKIPDFERDNGFGSFQIDMSTYFSDPDEDELTFIANSFNTSIVTTSVSGAILTIKEESIGQTDIEVIASDGMDEVRDTFHIVITDGDIIPPTVSADPASGTNMATSFDVVLTFSEDAIVTSDDITVTGNDAATVAVEGVVATVSIIDAEEEAEITIAVSADVADEAGNKITGTISWNYTISKGIQTFEIPLNDYHIQDLKSIDIENDGVDELVVLTSYDDTSPGGPDTSQILIYKWVTDSFDLFWSGELYYHSYGIQIQDINNDGYNDLLVACLGVQLFLNNSETISFYGEIVSTTYMETPLHDKFLVADLNNDDKKDLGLGSTGSENVYSIKLYQQSADLDFNYISDINGTNGNNMAIYLNYNKDGLIDILNGILSASITFININLIQEFSVWNLLTLTMMDMMIF